MSLSRLRPWFVLLVVAALLGGCAGVKKPVGYVRVTSTGREPREIYEHGQKMMKQGFFDKAVADFQELRNFHRDDPLSVKAQLALAEIRFRKGEFEEARYAYEEFATYHPRHPDLDFVIYRIGYTIWRRSPKLAGRDQSTTRAAVNRWTGFTSRFPESEYGAEVDKLLQKGVDRLARKELFVARFYAKRDAWAAVQGRAEGVLRRFPTSTHTEEALSLLARASHLVGEVERATSAREKLAAAYPDSTRLATVDRVLAQPPGTPPEEEIFVRPYRLPGGGVPQPGAQR